MLLPETEIYQENLKRLEKVARSKNYVLNEDLARQQKVIGLMSANVLQYGKPYCPCKQSRPISLQTDTLCPCTELEKEIAELGHCYCRLFYK